MAKYLGEVPIDVAAHPIYKDYEAKDWALLWIELHGGTDGRGNKIWLLDQVSQILNGTRVVVTEASWDNGQTATRFGLDEPSPAYAAWVDRLQGETYANGDREFPYDIGIMP